MQIIVDRSICLLVLDELCNDQQGAVVSPGVSSLVQCCFAATEDMFCCTGCLLAYVRSGHEGDTFILHLARLVGVDRQLIDALARKES